MSRLTTIDWPAGGPACATRDPELWQEHPELGKAWAAAAEQEAKAICSTCPALPACRVEITLREARGEEQGIWAGLTREDRALLRQGWRRGSHGAIVNPPPAVAS